MAGVIPLRIHLTAGNVNDIVPACDLLEGLLADKLLADRAHDANKPLALAERSAAKWLFHQRHAGCFNESTALTPIKSVTLLNVSLLSSSSFRRVATRYDKLAITFKAAVVLAACLIWLQ